MPETSTRAPQQMQDNTTSEQATKIFSQNATDLNGKHIPHGLAKLSEPVISYCNLDKVIYPMTYILSESDSTITSGI